MKAKKQVYVLFAAFYFFSLVVENNQGKIPKELDKLYLPVAKLTRMYSKLLEPAVKYINKAIKDIDIGLQVDYILVSVSIIAEYYEQTNGQKRLYYPMSYENILTLQDECEELNEPEVVTNSYKYAEQIVKRVLR